MADTNLSPAEQFSREVGEAQSSLNNLQQGARLARLRDEMEDIDTKTNSLPQRLANLRSRGYVFEKDLEGQATDLNDRWGKQRLLVLQQITQQSQYLDMDMRQAEAIMQQLAARATLGESARPLLNQVKSATESLASHINAAESSIGGMYNSFQNELSATTTHLDRVDWMLTQMAQASFQFLAVEAGIMAAEAVWLRDDKEDKDDPRGVLFLTDQRLVFEQKQEIATKKVLFITTAKEKVQKLAWETPHHLLEATKPSKQGLFKNEDHIEVTYASGAPFPQAHFHLLGQDCNEWQALLGKAHSREFDNDRVLAVSKEVEEKVKAAPTRCPVCGGAITKPVMRGMDSITCDYCGSVIRL